MSKTALITGASSGIGAELTRYHAAKGGDLVLVARSEGRLKQLKDELENKHSIKRLSESDLVPESRQKLKRQRDPRPGRAQRRRARDHQL